MISHPSTFLHHSLTDALRDHSVEAEHDCKLHNTQLDMVYKQNWFNLYVPKELGGMELSLPEILKLEECLAWADGSTAWVVTLCSGAAWFVGFWDEIVSAEIFSNKKVCIAGSGATTGSATLTKNGYLINGFWKYASGSSLATAFTANCIVHENGSPVLNQDGTRKIRSFVFLKNEVIVHSNWNMMGMVATASHSFEVKDVVVPINRCFMIDPAEVKLPNKIFQFPFLQLAETTLSVNLSGMAVRFLELCEKVLMEKSSTKFSLVLGETNQGLWNARQHFYDTVEKAWKENLTGVMSEVSRKALSQAGLQLTEISRSLTNQLFPLCGLQSADVSLEINRVWRNINTAGQHSLLVKRY